jgi:hypothetical protein
VPSDAQLAAHPRRADEVGASGLDWELSIEFSLGRKIGPSHSVQLGNERATFFQS